MDGRRSFIISMRLFWPRRPSFSNSSHRGVEWHPDGQDHYSILISMRLFTVTSLFIQVLGKVFLQDFKLSPMYGFAPMGSFVVLALTSMRLNRAEEGGSWRPKYLWYWLELNVQRIRQMMSRIRFNVIEIISVKSWMKKRKNLRNSRKKCIKMCEKHHTNGWYSVETNCFVNGKPFIQRRRKIDPVL